MNDDDNVLAGHHDDDVDGRALPRRPLSPVEGKNQDLSITCNSFALSRLLCLLHLFLRLLLSCSFPKAASRPRHKVIGL